MKEDSVNRFGNNWVRLRPPVLARLRGRCEYLVADLQLPDGRYLLDRYFVRHRVRCEYPQGDFSYCHPEYPGYVIYRVRFREADEAEAVHAMDEMYEQSALMDQAGRYDDFLAVMDLLKKRQPVAPGSPSASPS